MNEFKVGNICKTLVDITLGDSVLIAKDSRVEIIAVHPYYGYGIKDLSTFKRNNGIWGCKRTEICLSRKYDINVGGFYKMVCDSTSPLRKTKLLSAGEVVEVLELGTDCFYVQSILTGNKTYVGEFDMVL